MVDTAFATLQMRPDPNGRCDLTIEPTQDGRGRMALDRSLASSLLIALGSDRRAEPDDVLPPQLTEPTRAPSPLFGRRGWVGDVLLADGQRLGSRLWLLERGKRTEQTRATAEDYAREAVEPLEAYHDQTLTLSARWLAQPQALEVQVIASGLRVTQRVTTL